jgi:hypothetical protein
LSIGVFTYTFVFQTAARPEGWQEQERAYRCPVCDRRFASYDALGAHAMRIKKHETIFEHVWRLRFLLADAEEKVAAARRQREAARAARTEGMSA